MVGGCKPLIDCLVEFRLLIDDRNEWAEIHYKQELSPTGHDRIVISIEEFTNE